MSIDGISLTLYSATSKFRSRAFAVYFNTSFNCQLNFKSTKAWTLYKVDQNDNILSAIDVASYPSYSTAQLIIEANTLDYGNYRFTYNVSINTLNDLNQVTNASNNIVKVYFKIKQTGISVNFLQTPVKYLVIGKQQSITFDPRLYSYDLDEYAPINTTIFKYYCRTIDSLVANSYPSTSGTKSDVAMQYAFNSFSTGCFSSTSDFKVNSNFSLSITSGGLAYIPNRIYEFNLQATMSGVLYSQFLSVEVAQDNVVPIASLK